MLNKRQVLSKKTVDLTQSVNKQMHSAGDVWSQSAYDKK